MPKELFPFRYRDGLTGKWVRARVAEPRDSVALRRAGDHRVARATAANRRCVQSVEIASDDRLLSAGSRRSSGRAHFARKRTQFDEIVI